MPTFPRPPSKISSHDSHAPELTQCIFDGLTRLWQSQALFDYTLLADGQSFPVHRAVLASVSDYFYAMLTSGMKETKQDYVELKGVNARMLHLLLDYVYTGNLHITEDNVIGLLNAAAHLQISTAIKACLSFMNANISVENCVEILDISRLHSSDRDFSNLEDFVAENFSVLVESGHYLRLSFDSLKGLLCREELFFGPEENLFHAVVRWLEHDPEKRQKYHFCLMEHIRFPLMSINQVDIIIKQHPELMRDPICSKHLTEAQDYLSRPVHQRVLHQNNHTILRMKPGLLAIQDENVGKGWFALDTDKGKWYTVRKVDFLETHSAECIIVNDFLLLCGGMLVNETQSQDKVTGKCFIFDPREYKWTQLAPMCVPRQDFSLVEHNGYLYAIAGSMLDEISVTEKIERYSFETNQWELFTEMYSEWRPSYCVSACVVNDRIYACDGSPEDVVEGETPNIMAFLDISTRTWQKAPMKNEQKCGFPMWCKGDVIYSVEDDYAVVTTPTITWYDPKTGDSGLVFCPEVLSKAKIVAVNEGVYFIHGRLMEPQENYWTSDLCTEVVIKDKSVLVINHLDPFPDKEATQYCARLRLPWHQYIYRGESE